MATENKTIEVRKGKLRNIIAQELWIPREQRLRALAALDSTLRDEVIIEIEHLLTDLLMKRALMLQDFGDQLARAITAEVQKSHAKAEHRERSLEESIMNDLLAVGAVSR